MAAESTRMSPSQVVEHLAGRVPSFRAASPPERLGGGYLNYVWRVTGRPADLVVKVAPPYIASLPNVPLDTWRTVIEARALEAFGPSGPLADLAAGSVAPPRLIDYDPQRNVLVMEDVCRCLDLGACLRGEGGRLAASDARRAGEEIGRFVGSLHKRTLGDPQMASRFDNSAIQKTRMDVEYGTVPALCREAGFGDAELLGRRAVRLGEELLAPGVCLVMGDLWPPSILVSGDRLWIIDWELAHFGHPVQDVAHLAAHLWMHVHRAPLAPAAESAAALLESFLASYRAALGEDRLRIYGEDALRSSAIHFGCEILMRTIGPFSAGYLYDGLAADSPAVREALAVAAAHIREPENAPTFSVLR